MNDQIAQKAILNALSQHSAYSYRASTQAVNEVLSRFYGLSNKMVSELRELLENLSEAEKIALASGQYTTDQLKEIRSLLNDRFKEILVEVPETFHQSAVSMAVYEASYVSQLMTGAAATISGEQLYKKAKATPLAGGQLINEMFGFVLDKARKQVEYAIRDGINQGQTNQEIITRIRGKRTKVGNQYAYVGGIWDATKVEIERTVRTARSHVANIAYDDTWKALGFTHVKFVSTLDGRTSKICMSHSDDVYPIDSAHPQPPLHYNCRSILVGVDADGKLSGKRPFVSDSRPVRDIPKTEREGKIGQVSANTTFKSWFAQQDEEFKREWLGKSKYKLYAEGGYSLDRFVDPIGREYTLKELELMDKKTFKNLGLI